MMTSFSRRHLSVALFLVTAMSARATNWTVPSDYPTIQAAVSAAVPGDTIDVYSSNSQLSGAYVNGLAITFRATSGVYGISIQNCTLTNSSICILATNTASVTATITNNIFRQLVQEGVYIRGDGTASCAANVSGNNVNGGIPSNTWPALFFMARESAAMNLTVRNNTISNLVDADAIVVRAIKGGSNITGTIVQNTIYSAGTNAYDRGIWVDVVPRPDVLTHGSFTISSNTVRFTGGSGIKLRVMDDTNRAQWCGVDFTLRNNECDNNARAGAGEAAVFAEVGTTPGSSADAWLDMASNTVDAQGFLLSHGDGEDPGPFVIPGNPALLSNQQSSSAKYHIQAVNAGVATIVGTVIVGGCQYDFPQTLEDTLLVCNVLTNDWDYHGNQSTLRIVSVTQGTNGTVTIGGAGTNLTYTPFTNFFGQDSFTYTVANLAGANDWTGTAIVTVTVLPVNDPPSFSAGADQNVNEDCGPISTANWATAISPGPANESTQTVTFVTTNTSTGLFSAQPAVSPDGTLTFTPAANLFGSATVRVWCVDSGGTANGGRNTSTTQSFVIVVNPVNDAPTFTPGANQTVAEDAGPQSTNWATAISPGPPNEAGQAVNFIVTNDNPSLFINPPAINPTGTLTYCSATNANGSATVTVWLHDDGGTANGGVDTSAPVNFTITVTPVNDPPTALMLSSNSVAENLPAGTTVGVLSTIDPDIGDTFTYTLVPGDGATDNALFMIQSNTLETAAMLDYEAQSNRSVRIRTTDSGGLFLEQAFTIFILNRPDPQAITFPNPGPQVITNLVHLGASASSGLSVTFSLLSGPGQLDGTNLTFTGAGTVSVVASQPGNAEWLAAPDATNTFTVSKAAQAPLVFAPASPQTYHTTNTLTASGGSGSGAVSFSVLSGPGALIGPTGLTITSGTGSVLVIAEKAADATYDPTATTATVAAAKAGQAINFPAIGSQLTTNRVGLAAAADSELEVGFSLLSGPGQLNGTNLTFTSSGTVSILASQPGDSNFSAAPGVTNTFNVTKAVAPVTLSNLNQTYDGSARIVQASTVPASLAVDITYAGSSAAPTNAGSYAVTATVNEVMYQGWTNGTLVVSKADQTISFPTIGDQLTTNRIGLAAASSSGLGVSFSVQAGSALIIGGTNLSFSAVGDVSIVASQAGDSNWNTAPDVTNSFRVAKATQDKLVFTPASPQTYNTTNTLTTSGGSGTGAVSYAVSSGAGQIVGGNGFWVTAGTGSVAVVATKAEDGLYNAQSVTAAVAAAKANQAITFPAIPDQRATNCVGLSATAGSGLPVSFTASSGPATITNGTNLTFTGAGSVSIVASQAGDGNWGPAPEVTNKFNVSKAGAGVTLDDLNQVYDGSARLATASTVPAGLTVAITYNGSTAAPTEVGTYSVTGVVNDVIYTGGATGILTVTKGSQTISFAPIPRQRLTNVVNLAATASSGLQVTFSVDSGPAAITNGTTLSFTGCGPVVVRASQGGNANWSAAPDVTNAFLVGSVILWTDFNGDGISDMALFGPPTGDWYIRTVAGTALAWQQKWGYLGAWPVPGDYDGDGISDLAVYDPAAGRWYISTLAGKVLAWQLNWGYPGTVGVPGDYDGDGLCDLAVYDNKTGNWDIRTVAGKVLASHLNWGYPGTIAVPGDYDGDGVSDLAVYDPATGRWYIRTLAGKVLAWGSYWGAPGLQAVGPR